MILAQITGTTYDQRLLHEALGAIPGNPQTMSPQWLRDLLQRYKPQSMEGAFAHRHDSTAEAALQRISTALAGGGVGAATLVWNDHWVVVSGVNAIGDNQSAIAGVFIQDPDPVTASILYKNPKYRPPCPHGPDDNCGLGGRYGSPSTYVTTFGWKKHYWYSPFRAAGTVDAPIYTTVCFEPTGLAELGPSSVAASAECSEPQRTITEDEAKLAVTEGIQEHGLAAAGPLQCFLAGVLPGDASCEESHPHDGDEYWQVNLARPDDPQVAVGFVDAVTGEFLGIQAPPSETPIPIELYEFVVAALRNDSDVIDGGLDPSTAVVHSRRVWRPCHESMSPYYAFVRATLGSTDYYINNAGKVYRKLHDGHG